LTHRKLRIGVLGGGSWGTTVANLVAPRVPTTLWARDPAVVREIGESHSNERYLPGAKLAKSLRATTRIEEAS
jgi:glycerol-3-phosphate dehydrogenase (NAD(P)+)